MDHLRNDSPRPSSPRASAPRDAPIFIIGSGRSGTTLLRMMLCAHPRIYLTHEAYFYPWNDLLPSDLQGDAFVSSYLRTFSFRWLRLDLKELLREVPHDLPREKAHVLFEAVMRVKAREHGKTRFGDKTPPHSGHLANIFRDFPQARVIRIIRDPRAVTHSLSRMPWSSGTALFGAWIGEVERRQVAPFRHRFLQIRLENLLENPRHIMGQVLDYVGEPWDDRVLDHATFGPGPNDLPPMPWFGAAAEPRVSSGRTGWAEWNPATLRMVEQVTRQSMIDGGYVPAVLKEEPSRRDVMAARARELPQVLRDLSLLARLVRNGRKLDVQLETPEQKALFRQLNPGAWERLDGFAMPDPPPLPEDWQRLWVTASPSPIKPPIQPRAFLTPLYAGSIWLEGRMAKAFPNWRLRFPRDLAELEAKPAPFFELLQANDVFNALDTFVEIRRRGRMENEPDKNRTAAVVEVVARRRDDIVVVPMFVKFQSGRGMPMLLQGVRAAVEPDIAREVDFYRYLAGTIPVRTAQPYVVDSMTEFNRVIVALEYVEGYNPADWRGCPLQGIRAMLADVARMNAAFLGCVSTDPRTHWIPARTGLDYAAFVVTLAGAAPAWTMGLWGALARYFETRPITLVHGDFRPGNMLFQDDGSMARHEHPADESQPNSWPSADGTVPQVTLTDWEAVNAAPLLWDFTYCTIIGMRNADRRAYGARLLEEFVAALRDAGAPAEHCELARCQVEVELLTMVLYYIAALVVSKGYWDNQGNTLEDFYAWSGRILDAVRGMDADRVAMALGVEVELIRRFQREAAFKDRTRKLLDADPKRVGQIMDAHGDAGWLRLTEEYGRVFRYQGGVVTCEPADFRAILTHRPHTTRRPQPHRFADQFVPGAPGILFKDGDAWKQRLRALMTSFNPQSVAAAETRVRAIVETHVAQWPVNHCGDDLFREVSALGLQVALVHGYNLDPNDPIVQEFGKTLVAYKASTMNPDSRRRLDEFGLDWRKMRDLRTIGAAFYEFRGLVRHLDKLVQDIVRKQPWADASQRGWVQLLLAAGLEGRALTDELNHLYGAFTAADYTTTCALAELAHAPAWVARLRKEDTAQQAAELILQETSRRYPVAMVIYRELGESMLIGGETFPAGTLVMALPYALHHDAARWDHPVEFDPTRWQQPLSAEATMAYRPFLEGPRRCIGEDFAKLQMRIVLTTIFQRFELKLEARPEVNSYVIPRLAKPLSFRFESRIP